MTAQAPAAMRIATPDLVTNSYFPALAAEELGVYREEGLEAHVELLPSLEAVSALRDGGVDFVAGGAHTTLLAFPGWKGAKVVVADLDGGGGDALVRALSKDGYDALAVRTDVAEPADAEQMARATLDRFGRIDGLINNAALFQRPAMSRVPFEKIPVEEWDRLMAVNLRGIFLCCRAVVPAMKRQQSGKIVNITLSLAFALPVTAQTPCAICGTHENTAIGINALSSNTAGSFNTATGFDALRDNTRATATPPRGTSPSSKTPRA